MRYVAVFKRKKAPPAYWEERISCFLLAIELPVAYYLGPVLPACHWGLPLYLTTSHQGRWVTARWQLLPGKTWGLPREGANNTPLLPKKLLFLRRTAGFLTLTLPDLPTAGSEGF